MLVIFLRMKLTRTVDIIFRVDVLSNSVFNPDIAVVVVVVVAVVVVAVVELALFSNEEGTELILEVDVIAVQSLLDGFLEHFLKKRFTY